MLKKPVMNDPDKPLVSIALINYNYGCYLRQCFESIFAQTYDNIEICFSDNASTDDSWEIALEFDRKYPGIITLTRNRSNFGPDANVANCLLNSRGKYFVELCSDDAFHPDFVSSCVKALEANETAGLAMVHRLIIDENGNETPEPSFYNQSCLIDGRDQAAVFMFAAVNPSISQVMYNKRSTHGKSAVGGIASRWYGTRLLDFNLCCEYNMVYLKEPLLLHRIHSQSDSYSAAEKLLEVIGPFVLKYQYAEIASQFNMTEVVNRLPESLAKLGHLSLRYCLNFLARGNERCALRYFHLGAAILPEIMDDAVYKKLRKYWDSEGTERNVILKSLLGTDNLATRSVSYDPPAGSIPLG